MDMAFDYVTKCKREDELNEEYCVKWLQASYGQSRTSYDGAIYGLYSSYPSSGIQDFSTIRPSEDVYYYGTIVYDWLIANFSLLKDDVNNVEVPNLLYFGASALPWTSGEDRFDGMQLGNNYLLPCNGDPMFDSVKDISGIPLTNVKDAFLSKVHVESLRELSSIGDQTFHDIQQQLSYLCRFTNNNNHGVSVIDLNVLFNNLKVNNLNSLTENSQIVGGSYFLANSLDNDD